MDNVGIKTSEFWVTLIVSILGVLIALGVIPSDFDVQSLAFAVVGAVTGLYTIGRSVVKWAVMRDAPPPQ